MIKSSFLSLAVLAFATTSHAAVVSLTVTGNTNPERSFVENGGAGVFDPAHPGTNVADGVLYGGGVNTFVDRNHVHQPAAFDAGTGLLSTAGTNIVPLGYLQGQEYLRLPNDSKGANPFSAVVGTDVPSTFYLLLDNRLDGPSGGSSSPNTTDPVLGGNLQWVIDDGWVRLNTGVSPNGQADYTSIDEGNDGGLNQFFSVWYTTGTSATVGRGSGGNMHSMVIAPGVIPEPSAVALIGLASIGLLRRRRR